jgi:ATP-binding cassette subfamily G (WHITE) protein 2 (SNQ2)
MFKDLKVVGLGASTSYQPTLGSVINPLNLLETINSIRHPAIKDILSGFEGVVRPGEMLCEQYISTGVIRALSDPPK